MFLGFLLVLGHSLEFSHWRYRIQKPGQFRVFFYLGLDNNRIIFKPKFGIKVFLQLPKIHNGYKKLLELVEQKSQNNEIPFSIKLDCKNIQITFDEKIIYFSLLIKRLLYNHSIFTFVEKIIFVSLL